MTDEPFISFAQNREDVVLFRALGHIPRGRYIDVGANDPNADSVTRAFYDRGWRGMSIDPVPRYAQAHRDQRPGDIVHELAVTNSGNDEVTLYEVPETGLSTLHESLATAQLWRGTGVNPIRVRSRRLAELLTEAGWLGLDIHFMSVDVEGVEGEVLDGAELETWRPWVIVVEALEPDTALPSHERWQPQLEDSGYRFTLFDGLNRFFVAQEHWDDLHSKLTAPANILDNYQYYRTFELGRENGRLHGELIEREATLENLLRQHEAVLRDRTDIIVDRAALTVDRNAVVADRQRIYYRAEDLARDVERARERERAALATAVTWRTKATTAWTAAAAANQVSAGEELDRLRAVAAGLARELAATRATLSWRITRPLRAVRRRTGSLHR